MNKPVLAYHAIFSAYGFWLPNDPRGSWSDFVGAWDLFRAGGKATKTDETRSVAHRPHDRFQRLAAKEALARPPVVFTDVQVRTIGAGFANAVKKSQLTIWACAIMPDHVHCAIARSHLSIEQAVNLLKGEAFAPCQMAWKCRRSGFWDRVISARG